MVLASESSLGIGDGALRSKACCFHTFDGSERFAGLHGIAFLVQALDQDATDAGPHFGFAGTLGLRHDLDAGGHFLRLHFDDGNRHGAWLRRCSSRLVAGATGCAKRAEHG